jgi:HEAT repeat protein
MTDPDPAKPALSDKARICIAKLEDKDEAVRFANAIELGKLGEKAAWEALAKRLRGDEDDFVRRACARSLGELKAFEAFPDLIDSLSDPVEFVAVGSSRVIAEMAGDDFGFKQNQTRSERKRVVDKARKWWVENKSRLLGG